MSSGPGADTIVATATAPGRSAIAVVRIDGPEAVAIVEGLAGREFEPRRATHTVLRDAGSSIDDAVVVVYRAPASYTGNDLVEVSLHGSAYLVAQLMGVVCRRGARLAEPGEFTERAVLNGKLDLVQAEAIVDLVDARTALQARLSLRNLTGELSRASESMRASLLDMISRFEAALDFSDEGYEFIGREEAIRSLESLLREVRGTAATWARGHAIQAGLTAVILGLPNAGKSTLLNFLCGTERAIVTPLPGTTRDLLRETVDLGGLPVTFVDTAGLRETGDAIEEIGVGRARDAAARADLVLYLVDATRGMTDADRAEIGRLLDPIVIFTKGDLASGSGDAISVMSGTGLARLLARLDAEVRARFATAEEAPTVVSERQRAAFESCAEALEGALASVKGRASEEIVAVDLRRAANALGSLTGAISTDDVLREIFGRFCIGK
ncbi:MAG: tRNA uridine-5-carboxymethylaminomethyl(34) synthesis GTPase MnmE [Thermoanaerobaculia bacterium]